MLKHVQQTGSSSAGLLTASAIFIALLVYADQYAFNDNSRGFLSSLLNSVTESEPQKEETTSSSIDTETVQPLAQGIFETPTLSEHKDDTKLESPETEAIALLATPAEELDDPAVKQIPVPDSSVPVSYYTASYPSGDQSSMQSYYGSNSGLNSSQFYTSDARLNGQGRGRGTMNSDGEFNFSMKFKSRARMDADTDLNADTAVYGNAYQQHLYNLNTTAYPAYGYHYYRY